MIRKSCLWLMLAALCLTLTALQPVQAAPRPDAPTYARRGAYTVGTREFKIEDKDRPLVGTVWYPAIKGAGQSEETTYTAGVLSDKGRAVQDGAPDSKRGTYPLIIFSHGFMGVRLQSLWYTEHLASYGFVVMSVDHPGSTLFDYTRGNIADTWALRPLDVLRELGYAEKTLNPALDNVIDLTTVAVTGHSVGGYTALAAAGARLDLDGLKTWCVSRPDAALRPDMLCNNTLKAADAIAARRGLSATPKGMWPATTDPRIKAVIALSPANSPAFGKDGINAIKIPALIMVGSKDQATIPERDAYPAYGQLGSAKKALAVFDNGGHYIFVQSCPALAVLLNLFYGCSDLVWDMDRVHDLSNHIATAFLLDTLKGDKAAATALETTNFAGVQFQIAR